MIKLCGLSTLDSIGAAVELGVSHIGLNFFAKSPRYVAPEHAQTISAAIPATVRRVGVFVDADDALLERVAPFLDVLQLHGQETPARVADIKARFGLETWRAAGVSSRAEILAAIAATRHTADRLLFDAKAPQSAPLSGGNGLAFDWRLLDQINPGMAWGLAGGLDAGNVGAAMAATGAAMVDVSSGIEDAPGVKSIAKIRAFVAAVRAAE
jgi:phosphoribosylanthranilate isomerase